MTLPKNTWDWWVTSFGARLIEEDNSDEAVRLFENRQSERHDAGEPDWLPQAYCETAQWDRYWQIVRELPPRKYKLRTDIARSGVYSLLNAMGSRSSEDMELYLTHLVSAISPHREPLDPQHMFLGLLMRGGTTSPYVDLRDGRHRSPVERLRQVLVQAGSAHEREFLTVGTEDLAALFRPDPEWVDAWDRATRHEYRLDQIANDLRALARHPVIDEIRSHELLRTWARRFAGQVKVLRFEPRDLFERPADLATLMRGDNPELRGPIRRAIAAMADRHGLAEAGDLANTVLPVPVGDLRPEALPDEGPGVRTAIIQMVEYVDRSGVMRQFLDGLWRRYPDVEQLGRVRDTFVAWDDAHIRMFERLTG